MFGLRSVVFGTAVGVPFDDEATSEPQCPGGAA